MIKNIVKLFIILSMNLAHADVILPAIRMNKGDICPHAGILLSDEQARKIYTELENCDHIRLINDSLKKSINLYQKNEVEYKAEISELKVQNLTLLEATESAKKYTVFQSILFFGLGVVTTGLISYAVHH